MDDPFYVVIHDVAPPFQAAIQTMLAELQPWLQGRLSAAVVPCWHGVPLSQADWTFGQWVQAQFGEVLLHGYEHYRLQGQGFVSCLTGRADEFAGLSAPQAEARLGQGQRCLRATLGQAAQGFVPPAWQWGPLTVSHLAGAGLRYIIGFGGAFGRGDQHISLSTWSWDTGRVGQLGLVGHWVGYLLFVLRPQAQPCLVFHPADVRRGFWPLGLRLVRRFLDRGYKPTTFQEVFDQSAMGQADR